VLIFKIQRSDVGHTYIGMKTAFSRTEREARYCETGISGPSPVIIQAIESNNNIYMRN
jgi:hypothetical protein